MEEESNGELAILDTLLKGNNGNLSIAIQKAILAPMTPTLQLSPPNELQE